MNEKTVDSTAKVMARRRLVRGVFAAPAALTLYSGGAIAATSVSCVAGQQATPLSAGTNPTTAWVRVPLWAITASGNRGSIWVNGADMAALAAPSSYLSSTEWQLIARENNSAFTVIGSIEPSTPIQPLPSNNSATPVVTNTYVGVRIDGTGRIIGVEPLSTAGSAISGSCWTSFGGTVI